MTNFEKMKEKFTIGNAINQIIKTNNKCHFCVYSLEWQTCTGEKCRDGVRKWLESEVK